MRAIPWEELSTLWPRVEPQIARALEHGQGDEGLLDVFVALARGAYTLWEGEGFVAVTEVRRYPQQTVMTILYAGGEGLDAMQRAFDDATHFCRRNAIDVIRIWGREGWERLLGLEKVGVILQKRISP